MQTTQKNRLEEIRKEIKKERVSYEELVELAALAHLIDPGDVELLEAAGIKEGATVKKPKLKKSDVVTIEGRRWFEKTNGNTYHSCDLIVNNEVIDRVSFTYGYGDQYRQTGRELLAMHYDTPLNSTSTHWDEKPYNIRYNVTDVQRKKDL